MAEARLFDSGVQQLTPTGISPGTYFDCQFRSLNFMRTNSSTVELSMAESPSKVSKNFHGQKKFHTALVTVLDVTVATRLSARTTEFGCSSHEQPSHEEAFLSVTRSYVRMY